MNVGTGGFEHIHLFGDVVVYRRTALGKSVEVSIR